MEGLAADMYENEMRLYGVLKDNLSASELKGLVELLDSTDIPGIRPEALAQEREVVYVLDFVGDQGASQVRGRRRFKVFLLSIIRIIRIMQFVQTPAYIRSKVSRVYLSVFFVSSENRFHCSREFTFLA